MRVRVWGTEGNESRLYCRGEGKGKTWMGGQGCYIVKHKELMGTGRPVGARPPPGRLL